MADDKEKKDCPFKLIELIDKPKEWRREVSEILIEHHFTLKEMRRENYAILGLLLTILGCIIKLAIFP